MRVSRVKTLFWELTKRYFQGATVIYSHQSRSAKKDLSLVTIKPGNVKRPHMPNYEIVDGVLVGHYLSRIPITVNLFTNGEPLIDDQGKVYAYEDTALDDILSFADFLNSPYVVDWCRQYDISIMIDGEAQNLTGLLNETNYAFRAMLTVLVYFTQKAVGTSAVLSENSILYPTGEVNAEGEPVRTTETPLPTSSTTGDIVDKSEEREELATISPVFDVTSSGGGSDALANEEAGYFDKIKSIQENEGNE